MVRSVLPIRVAGWCSGQACMRRRPFRIVHSRLVRRLSYGLGCSRYCSACVSEA
jgi:hypothetical protein